MANDEHVAILKKGVDVWNKWRDKNPNIRPDLRQANLSGANLSGAILGWAILYTANLFRTHSTAEVMIELAAIKVPPELDDQEACCTASASAAPAPAPG